MTTVLEEFRLQSRFCGEFGSRFTKELLTKAADDIEAGGICARLTEAWAGNPRGDAVSLRLAGALHAAALTGRDARLAAEYPGVNPQWSMDRVWPIAQAFLTHDQGWVRDFMKSPPQTNETARAAGLVSAFLWLAEGSPQPFHMLELGASAGLNLNWDRFCYTYPRWGRDKIEGPIIPTAIEGPVPAWRAITVDSRAACDQYPVDPSNPDDRLRLQSYIWADQAARMERLNAAINLAHASGLKVEKADAAQWVKERLAGEPPAGTTVVYHSVFYQYPPRDVRIAIAEAIEEAGARTSGDRRLAWVRFEPESIIGGQQGSTRYIVNAVSWNNGARSETTLADADPHGRSLVWAPS